MVFLQTSNARTFDNAVVIGDVIGEVLLLAVERRSVKVDIALFLLGWRGDDIVGWSWSAIVNGNVLGQNI